MAITAKDIKFNRLKRYILSTGVFFTLLTTSFSTLAEEEKIPQPPDSEIHLFDLNSDGSKYSLDHGRNISNNIGYDNQPYFTQDSQSVLFVSMRDGKQTDVYQYDIKTKKSKQLTQTPYSEYSPKVATANSISFVSEGGVPYQTVWQKNLESGKRSWLFNSKEPVGYYHVNHNTGDVLFWSRYGWSVQYLNLKRNENRFVSGNALPSSPKLIPGTENFSFVHRQTNGEIWIKSFNPKDFSIMPIAPVTGSNNDYNWTPNGNILMVQENTIFIWKKDQKNRQWKKVQDLNEYFEGSVSRLAVSPDGRKIALVENR